MGYRWISLVMTKKELRIKFQRAKKAVNDFLASYDLKIGECEIRVDESAEGTHYEHPKHIIVQNEDVPESVIAHDLIHVVQQTLEVFKGFKWLYHLLSEGLAEFVAKLTFPHHAVKYKVHHELVSLLYALDKSIVKDLITLDSMQLSPDDVDTILNSPHVSSYSKNIIKKQSDHLKSTIQRAINAKIDGPTFISYGEDLRAWKFLINPKFNLKRREINELLESYFNNIIF